MPEFAKGQTFNLSSLKPVDEYREAKAFGYQTRPVLLGPVTYLKLAKSKDATLDPLSLLGELILVYIDLLRRLAANGAEWFSSTNPASCSISMMQLGTPFARPTRPSLTRCRS